MLQPRSVETAKQHNKEKLNIYFDVTISLSTLIAEAARSNYRLPLIAPIRPYVAALEQAMWKDR